MINPEKLNTAIIHTDFEREPLLLVLENIGIPVVYQGGYIPEGFNNILDEHQVVGAILHNVAPENETQIVRAIRQGIGIILLVNYLVMPDDLKPMYQRFDYLSGIRKVSRYVGNNIILQEYLKLFEEDSSL